MYKLISYILLSISLAAYAQAQYTLKAEIKGMPYQKVYLFALYGHYQNIIDSAQVDTSGFFQFNLSENLPVGMYRLVLGKTKEAQYYGGEPQVINFIFNHKKIELGTHFLYPVDSMQVISSPLSMRRGVGGEVENKLYYEYLQTKRDFNIKLDVLYQSLIYYPKTDNFYKDIEKQFMKSQLQQEKYVNVLIENNPKTYVARLIKMEKVPVIDPKLTEAEQNEYLKQHFFDETDFADTTLLRSDVISKKIFNYILLYHNKSFNEEQQKKVFIEAVDTILFKAMDNETVYNYVLDYLILGFDRINNQEVLSYIIEQYTCSSDQHEDKVQKRIENFKKLAVGKQAPEIEMTYQQLLVGSSSGSLQSAYAKASADTVGNQQSSILTDGALAKSVVNFPSSLYAINAEYTLLIFWSSACPHCSSALKQLKKIYEQYTQNLSGFVEPRYAHSSLRGRPDRVLRNFEILAISLDEDESVWKKTIIEGEYNWLNYSEQKGWDSKVAQDYYLYATPTMLLLDKKKKIIAKPLTVEQLKAELREKLAVQLR